jgi:hypothetical protein
MSWGATASLQRLRSPVRKLPRLASGVTACVGSLGWPQARAKCQRRFIPSLHSRAIRTHGSLYSSSIRPSQQDSLLYTQFFCTHSSSISSSIYSIHCRTHLSLYLNISICDLVLKDLLRRI